MRKDLTRRWEVIMVIGEKLTKGGKNLQKISEFHKI
jgi:hypothetical protein